LCARHAIEDVTDKNRASSEKALETLGFGMYYPFLMFLPAAKYCQALGGGQFA